ncbi:MAG: hypothetical protein HGA47_01235 [Zoogloea sp.]|nr:hypothetical protein [Zoogloea sp.]
MTLSNSKAQKLATVIQIIGGFVAALVLGFSYVSTAASGERGLMLNVLGVLTLAAFAYAGFFTRRLSRLVQAEKK